MKKLAAVVAVPLLLLFGLIIFLIAIVNPGAGILADAAQRCPSAGPAVTVNAAGLPAQVQGGGAVYRGEQLTNAAAIMLAAKDHGFDVKGQTIGVTAAIGESSLINVNHGDLVGPDSTGLFQQRDLWAPRADRMDPYQAATMFLTGGLDIDGAGKDGIEPGLDDITAWESMTPTAAIHAVQHNADPYHYEKFWDDAVAIVEALSGAQIQGVVAGTGGQSCAGAAPGSVSAAGWVRPTTGPITSGFGMRWGSPHNGIDFGAPCGTPVYAANAGTVVLAALGNVSPAGGYGTLVAIDHGGGVVTRYAHANNEDVLVHVGDQVTAGQQVTRVGTYGDSTGCHLHFEVQQAGQFIDPAPWLTGHGVQL